ncbi:MAG: lysophospholipid acyltransferase family protein [Candidatus Cloacimonetes bacterium]|nr:lysophospholipid acyltransferase family protein [Candidatus Cloacimonadota bacterium]
MKDLTHQFLLFIERQLSYVFLNVLYHTMRYTITGLKKPYPHAIYAFWHRDIMPLMINRKNEKVAIMISPSRDGNYMAAPAIKFGFIAVRGSSSRKGMSALKEMIKLSKNHSLAITPDGPKGPAQILKEGVLQLAYLTKLPIIATRTHVSDAWVFNSWDRFYCPYPFSRIKIEYSKPFYISSKENFEEYKKEIESFMNEEGWWK